MKFSAFSNLKNFGARWLLNEIDQFFHQGGPKYINLYQSKMPGNSGKVHQIKFRFLVNHTLEQQGGRNCTNFENSKIRYNQGLLPTKMNHLGQRNQNLDHRLVSLGHSNVKGWNLSVWRSLGSVFRLEIENLCENHIF